MRPNNLTLLEPVPILVALLCEFYMTLIIFLTISSNNYNLFFIFKMSLELFICFRVLIMKKNVYHFLTVIDPDGWKWSSSCRKGYNRFITQSRDYTRTSGCVLIFIFFHLHCYKHQFLKLYILEAFLFTA